MQKLTFHREQRIPKEPRKIRFSKLSVLATAIIISCSGGSAFADSVHVKEKPVTN